VPSGGSLPRCTGNRAGSGRPRTPRLALNHQPPANSLSSDLTPFWTSLAPRYRLEAARTRLLIGRACGELGDGSEAEMSLAGAAAVFERLGAAPDLSQVEQLRGAEARRA